MNPEILLLREVIVKVTQLLAGKGLTVTQQGAQAFVKTDQNGVPVLVNIPYIPDNATSDLLMAIQGFVDHEVAHILFTEFTYKLAEKAKSKSLHSTHNMVEDPLIEKLMGEKFPGAHYNLGRLHEFFLDKITAPYIKEARGDTKKEFEALLVVLTRALSGQKVFADYMTAKGYWEQPLVKAFMSLLPKNISERMQAMRTTRDSYEIAVLFDKALRPPLPPPPPPPPAKSDCKDGSEGKSDSKKKSDGKGSNKDKPEDDEDQGSGGEPSDAESDGEPSNGESESKDEKPKKEPKPKKSKPEKSDEAEGDEDEAGGEGESKEEENDESTDAGASGEPEPEGDDPKQPAEDAGDADGEDGDAPAPAAADDSDEDGDEPAAGDEGDADEDEADEDEAGSDGEKNEGSDEDGSESGSDGADDGAGNASLEGDGAEGEQPEGELEAAEDDKDGKAESFGMGASNEMRAANIEIDDDPFNEAIKASITDLATHETKVSPYKIFTADYDKIEVYKGSVNAEEFENFDSATRHMIGPMQKDIERLMAARSQVLNVPGYRSGRLHAAALHKLRVGDDRVFRRRHEHRSKDTAVSLVIDNSGSMHGSKMTTAMQAAYALSQTLERVRIAHEAIGFTTGSLTREMMNAIVAEERRASVRYTRVEPLYMPIYKDFGEHLTPAVKQRFASAAQRQSFLINNVDGESIANAAKRLLKRNEKRKVMIVLSDGNPACNTTDYKALNSHLQTTVTRLSKMGIEVIGIGVEDGSVRHYYPKHIVIKTVNELPSTVMKELRRILLV